MEKVRNKELYKNIINKERMMETNSGKNEGMDMSISIKDMLMRVCLKWRAMIVWAVILAILFNGLGVLKEYKAVQTQKQLEDEKTNTELQLENAEKKVTELEKGLSDREIADVKRVVESYADLQSRYTVAREYFENSAKMQLDPSRVPTMMIQYNINTNYQVEYPIIDKRDNTSPIISAYCDYIKSDETYDALKNAMVSDVEVSYVKELVDAVEDCGNISVTIIAPTEEDCKAMGDVVEKTISKATGKLQNIYGAFEVTPIMDSYGCAANSTLLNDQTTVVNNMNSIRSAIVNITSGMNDAQKEYYSALLDYDTIANPPDAVGENLQNLELAENSENTSINLIHAKMLILGILVGFFLVVCWYALLYILSNRMRTADDLEEVYGMRLMGTLTIKTKKNIVDRKIQEAFSGKNDFTYEEQMRMICAGIRISAKKLGIQKLYITGSSREKLDSYYAEIAKQLKAQNLDVQYGVSVIYDPESLEKMAESDGVVLVEKTGSSLYKDIKKEMDCCLSNKVQIIGAVVLE